MTEFSFVDGLFPLRLHCMFVYNISTIYLLTVWKQTLMCVYEPEATMGPHSRCEMTTGSSRQT